MAGRSSELLSKSELPKDRKKGFSVGPDNLPDGVHRRKGRNARLGHYSCADVFPPVRKIKQSLIRKAQIKKSYSKLKSREPDLYARPNGNIPGQDQGEETPPTGSLELHPERQAMLDDIEARPLLSQAQIAELQSSQRPRRQSKPIPFHKEAELAKQRKEEREARHKAYEEALRERDAKREKRERFRKAMAKARTGGRAGSQRKLGRESKVLLERVLRVVNG